MYYHTLSMSGFGPHIKKTTYEFTAGIMFITGKNGSGKSTIFDGIQWCLFGSQGSQRALKDRTSVINSDVNSATVILSLSHEQAGEVEIERKLTRAGKHTLSVTVDGESIGSGIKHNQAYIDHLCGDMRHDVFSSVYMLMSSPLSPPSSFLGATPAVRRDILSRVVDPLEKYASAYKVISKKLTEQRKHQVALEASLETTRELQDAIVIPDPPEVSSAQLSDRLSLAQNSHNPTHTQSVGLRREKDRLEQRIDDISNRREVLQEKCADTEDSVQKMKEKKRRARKSLHVSKKKLPQLQAQMEVAEFVDQELERQIRDATQLDAALVRDSESLTFRMSILGDAQEEGVCPVCGSPTDVQHSAQELDAHHQDVEYQRTVVAQELSMLHESRNRLHEGNYNSRHEELHDVIYDLSRTLEQAADKHDIFVERYQEQQDMLRALNQEYQEASVQLSEVIEALDSHRSDDTGEDLDALFQMKVEAQSVEENIVKERNNFNALGEKIESLENQMDDCIKRVNQLINVRFQASPDGDLSADISSLMNDIGEQATELYRSLFEDDRDITIFDGEEEGERTCVITCDGRDVATYSHGEQLRLYGCLQAAFTLCVYQRTQLWVPMMWDEPSLAADQDVVETIFSLPAEVTPEFHQSFIITRDPSVEVDHDEVICLTSAA